MMKNDDDNNKKKKKKNFASHPWHWSRYLQIDALKTHTTSESSSFGS